MTERGEKLPFFSRHSPALLVGLMCAAAIGLALAIQGTAYLNHDVAYLAWVNGTLLGGGRLGIDFYESNHPLAILIYAPGWMLAKVIGPGAGVRLWAAGIAAVAMLLVWRASRRDARIWLTLCVAILFAVAFPREFAQREHLAFLLCAPYVVGYQSDRRLGVLSGVMAGLGFAIKPYFLAALVLVFLVRRRIRTEELAIAATGLAYAATLLAFFPSYVFVMVPAANKVYWAFEAREAFTPLSIMFAALLVIALIVWSTGRDRTTLPLLAAAVGFAIAAAVQHKWYQYHFVAAWSYLILFLAGQAAVSSRQRRVCAGLLLVSLVPLWNLATGWRKESIDRNRTVSALVKAADKADTFSTITVHPYPASPTLFYTRSSYVGMSNGQWFLAAAAITASGEDNRPAEVPFRMAADRAVAELRRRPELVIVNTDWRGHSSLRSRHFDGLAMLQRDPAFRQLWAEYRPAGSIDHFQLFERIRR